MALENNFYEEINSKEIIWMELIEKKLLNIYYIKMELLPFYNAKLEKLRFEYNLTKSKLLEQIIKEIEFIVNKMKEFEVEYRKGSTINLNDLVPLFLINKLNNRSRQREVYDLKEIRNQVLAAICNYRNMESQRIRVK